MAIFCTGYAISVCFISTVDSAKLHLAFTGAKYLGLVVNQQSLLLIYQRQFFSFNHSDLADQFTDGLHTENSAPLPNYSGFQNGLHLGVIFVIVFTLASQFSKVLRKCIRAGAPPIPKTNVVRTNSVTFYFQTPPICYAVLVFR